MTPDDAARKALEEAYSSPDCGLDGCGCCKIAINRLARAAWEAGFETMIKRSIYEPSWLPPKDPDNRT